MSRNYHDKVQIAVERRVEAEPLMYPILIAKARQMEDQRLTINEETAYGHLVVDWFQNWDGDRYDIADAHTFILLRNALLRGVIVGTTVNVGQTPVGDAAVAENNRRLSEMPAPFKAKFIGEVFDQDGALSWSEPITLWGGCDCGSKACRPRVSVTIPPGNAPLEVGTTEAGRTLLHLFESNFLARWPFERKRVALWHVVDRTAIWPTAATRGVAE